MIENVHRGNQTEADAFSRKLTTLCEEVFDLAGRIGYGNAFTNANKAMDHFFAHGPEAPKVAPPLLYSGKRLQIKFVAAAGAALKRHGLMPESGYLGSAAR
jgi:hypothetical protein